MPPHVDACVNAYANANARRPSIEGVECSRMVSRGRREKEKRKEKMEPGTQKGAGKNSDRVAKLVCLLLHNFFFPPLSFECGCYGSFRHYLSSESLLSPRRVGSKRAAKFLAAPGPRVARPASVVWGDGSIRVDGHRVWAAGAIVDNQGWQRERQGVALVYAIAGQSSRLSSSTSYFYFVVEPLCLSQEPELLVRVFVADLDVVVVWTRSNFDLGGVVVEDVG